MTHAASKPVWVAKSENFWIIRFLQTCCSQCLWRLKSFSWLWCRSIGTFKKLIQKLVSTEFKSDRNCSEIGLETFFRGIEKKFRPSFSSCSKVFSMSSLESPTPIKCRLRTFRLFPFFFFFVTSLSTFCFCLSVAIRTGPVKCPLMDFGVKPPFWLKGVKNDPLGTERFIESRVHIPAGCWVYDDWRVENKCNYMMCLVFTNNLLL